MLNGCVRCRIRPHGRRCCNGVVGNRWLRMGQRSLLSLKRRKPNWRRRCASSALLDDEAAAAARASWLCCGLHLASADDPRWIRGRLTRPSTPRTLPLVYGGGLLILGVCLALRPGPRPDGARPSPASPASRRRWRSLAAQCCAIVGFGVAIRWAGPWLALAGLLVAALLIAGERRWWVLVLAPAVTSALAWVLIAIVLEVYVDPGRWFS